MTMRFLELAISSNSYQRRWRTVNKELLFNPGLDGASNKMIKLPKERRYVMAVQEQKAENTLEKYIAEVRSVWGDGRDPQLPFKVKALMEKLFASTSPDDPWMAELIREGKPSRELYRDPDHGFIQMGHIHKQGHGNQPHDHGPCWVVYGSYKGVTEITKYKRTDDGSQPGVATLEKERLDRLSPGVVQPYLKGDIHSTNAVEGPGVVFRFLSYDLDKIERNRYNKDKGTVTKLTPQ
jgi:hypothetical protein